MKQPENSIDIFEDDVWFVDLWSDEGCRDMVNWVSTFAYGRTRKSALKAAHRRLERLTRDVVRELEILEKQDG